ncbi:single-stranded DNA-binding protein [Mycobacterium sp. 1274756.6]|uniref:single-stranded DNA-binding protein n=1 Tax=Mycobacterium sp. 1274756.6 TaxID=1834076 RepID=UPI0007FCB0D9|nr:single-stranded DNA-binding protein [Mycobacterium sp. 1274756.6]OBJ72315.1 hypothetical protein A5643_05815 [Mycobacterium sp. 1274756.6]
MFETPLTVVGTVVTEPRRRQVGDREVISLRVASNSRRRTAEGTWEPGNSLFITVNCWGKLVTGVGAALAKGAPVIAVGHVYTSEYDDKAGVRRSSLEMRASAVGPDLSRTIARIEKPAYTGAPTGPSEPATPPAADDDADTAAAEPAADEDADTAGGSGRLPLTA